MTSTQYFQELGDRWYRSWKCGCPKHPLDRLDVDNWLKPLLGYSISSDETLLDIALTAEGDLFQYLWPMLGTVPIRGAGRVLRHWLSIGKYNTIPALWAQAGVDLSQQAFQDIESGSPHAEAAAE